MYCSLRMYVDKTLDSVNAQTILRLFELFANTLEFSFDYISYMLFDPDNDRMVIDKQYSYDLIGKNLFRDTKILPVVVGQSGTSSAPFITATCTENTNQLYSTRRIQIQYPVSSKPFIISVDYAQKGTPKLTFETYNLLIQSLAEIGFCINNGFFHIYRRKNEAATLDGGQIGSALGCSGRINLKNYLKHQEKGCRNRLMGIYCANSIRMDSLGNDALNSILSIVGNNNVMIANNICSFSLGNMQKLTPLYRISYAIMIQRLKKATMETGNGLREPF